MLRSTAIIQSRVIETLQSAFDFQSGITSTMETEIAVYDMHCRRLGLWGDPLLSISGMLNGGLDDLVAGFLGRDSAHLPQPLFFSVYTHLSLPLP